MEVKKYEICQSCGVPKERDLQGGGTNADGSKSEMYCSRCFQKGVFTAPDRTVTEMQEFVKGKLEEFKVPDSIAGEVVKGIPELERWKR